LGQKEIGKRKTLPAMSAKRRSNRLTESLATAGEIALFAVIAPIALVSAAMKQDESPARPPAAAPKAPVAPDSRA
jgi:hypothetical protein